MNSMSKKYYDGCEKEHKCEKDSCPTILKCGCPVTTNITTATDYTAASINVNLSELCDPKVRIDFSANLVVPTGATASTLTFQLYKQYRCYQQLYPVGSSISVTVPATATSQTISFFICDGDLCGDECFSYVLQVTNSTATTATLSNSNISIIATCDRHEKCCKQNNCGCGCGCGR